MTSMHLAVRLYVHQPLQGFTFSFQGEQRGSHAGLSYSQLVGVGVPFVLRKVQYTA